MIEPHVPGIDIRDLDGRVIIDVEGKCWEGSPAEAERLLTRLHYVLGRARPGTHIASIFLNGQLWGGKAIEPDERTAIREMRRAVEQLAAHVDALEAAADRRADPA